MLNSDDSEVIICTILLTDYYKIHLLASRYICSSVTTLSCSTSLLCHMKSCMQLLYHFLIQVSSSFLVTLIVRIGLDINSWSGVIGKHDVRRCISNKLITTFFFFHLPTRNRTSWIHICSKYCHLIDSVIIRTNKNTGKLSMCVVECFTDHCLLLMNRIFLSSQPGALKK